MDELLKILFGREPSGMGAFPVTQNPVTVEEIMPGQMPVAQPQPEQSRFRMPDFSGISLPELSMPNLRMPDLSGLRMPEFNLPMPGVPEYMQGLIANPEEAQKRAQQAGLMNAAIALLESSGPSPQRTSLGQAIGRGAGAYQQGAQGSFDQILQGMLIKSKLKPEAEKLTGEYANLANLIYGTSDPAKLPKDAVSKIIEQVNRKASLEGGIGPEGVGKSGLNEVDKSLLSSGSRLSVLNRISQNYDPKFLETKFKAGMTVRSFGEKLGRPLDPTERNELSAYTTFRQDTVRQLNQYINEITGAAIGQGEEADRLKSGVPNPGTGFFDGDSPTEFAAKLQNTIKDLKMAEARLHYIKTSGLKLNDVSLAQMPQVMKKREQEIISQFKLDPAKPEERAIIRNRLAQEFGLLR